VSAPGVRAGDLLSVQGLTVRFHRRRGAVTAVDGVSFSLRAGETLGLVGESGAGKSTVAFAIVRLIDPPGEIASGRVEFEGRDLSRLSEREMSAVRGNRIGMIFQDPMSTLNPMCRVGDQIAEGLIVHRGLSRREARARAVESLHAVGIPSAAMRANAYPHQLSGGMQQRVTIATAVALEPALIIADEPTTALDVTIQAQILDLMAGLVERRDSSLILVTHNLAVVAEVADRVAVMYGGRLVEMGPKAGVLDQAAHPYTRGLLDSIPTMTKRAARLTQIQGIMPSPDALPSGCAFRTRCALCRLPECLVAPPLREATPGRWVACHFPLA
jgi:oligopeptide/dipeptide ABC transporter ATP-binding protein